MPNGTHGDHPFTDILHHGSSEFGEPVDGLVKVMVKLPGFAAVSDRVAAVLWDLSPIGRAFEREALVRTAMEQLTAIRSELEQAPLTRR